MENKKVNSKNKRKSEKKRVKPKKKTCKQFCKEVFLPERERVEIEFSKNLIKISNISQLNFSVKQIKIHH